MKLSEIRKDARDSLKEKWGKAACITLAYMLVSFVVTIVQKLIGDENIFYNILDFIYFIINIPLSFGLIVSFTKLSRGEDVKAFDLFKEGFYRFKKSWGILAQTLLRLLIPFTVFIVIMISIITCIFFGTNPIYSQIIPILLLLLIALLIAILVYLNVKSLLYVYAYNISYDNPDLSSKECVLESAKLMKGNRGKYFLLGLTFIGWGFLAVLTFGIGMFWFVPYIYVSYICLYKKLVNDKSKDIDNAIHTKL